MNADRLLAHYEKIADAPDATARFRRFILDLAVRGKLVPQYASDEPSPDLLTRIAKDKLGQADLPQGWRRAKVGSILEFQYGKGLKASERLDEGPVPVFGSNGIVGFTGEPLTDRPAIIVGRKGSAGALNLCDGPSWTTDVAYFVENPSFFDLRFTLNALAVLDLDKLGKGVKPGLSRSEAYDQIIAIPPLAEQRRIVAKVDELMGLCDLLEAARAGREVVRDQLAAASLARLTAPSTAAPCTAATALRPPLNVLIRTAAPVANGDPRPKTGGFVDHARFVLDALPQLTARPIQIKAFRQTILSLAVCGKLVPQDARDDPAAELLKRIATKRAELLMEGYPNPDEALTQVKKLTEQSVPSGLQALPEGWVWATLLQCSALVIDCKNKTAPYASSGIRLIRTTNVRDGRMNGNDQRYVDLKTYQSWSARCTPEPGDILITREAPMGEVCLIPPGERICLGQRMMLARLIPETIDRDFMIYSLRDPNLMDRVQDKPVGATVQHLRVGGVETLLVPVPPLAEQRRIVARVDALMSLCDRLEESLTATAAIRRELLDALVAEALTPAPAGARDLETGHELDTANVRASTTKGKERSAVILTLAYERHRAAKRDKTFGHVKAQKILHLVEAEAQYDLGRNPVRDAAGPNDFEHMLSVEEWALQRKRFRFEKIGSGYTFRPLSEFDQVLPAEADLDAKTRTRIEKIIDFFIPMDMETAEVVATVYAAWNNLLIEGKHPEDSDIVRAAREDWHSRKINIPREKFVEGLRHLRKTEFVPSGRGKYVPAAHQQDLFLGHEN